MGPESRDEAPVYFGLIVRRETVILGPKFADHSPFFRPSVEERRFSA
jgi:hypothetical protein